MSAAEKCPDAAAPEASAAIPAQTEAGVLDPVEQRRAIARRKLEDPLYYADYLGLDKILNAQHLKSEEAGHASSHEMLFIIVHQTYELWFKQILFEIDMVRAAFSAVPMDDRNVGIAVQRLGRIREIQAVLLQQMSILETMSPLDFLEFRDYLFPASGFQSAQFRLVENKLGLPAASRITYGLRGYCTYLNTKDAEVVAAAEHEVSLFDLVEAWLERTPCLTLTEFGFDFWDQYKSAVAAMLDEDERSIRANSHLRPDLTEMQVQELTRQREHYAALFDADKYAAMLTRGDRRMSYRATQALLLITLHHDEPLLQLPYRLLQALSDIDERFTAWRYRHALMVHRQLGSKMGTGGSSGYHYLRATTERHKIFADLNVATYLIPRYMLTPLPAAVRSLLAFHFQREAADAGAAALGPAVAAPAAADSVAAGAGGAGEPAPTKSVPAAVCPVTGRSA